MNTIETSIQRLEPSNKGKFTGQKAPLRLRDIWAIRVLPPKTTGVRERLPWEQTFKGRRHERLKPLFTCPCNERE